MWRANIAYPDLEFVLSARSWQVGRTVKGPLHLQGGAGCSGRDKQGGQQVGSGSLQSPRMENY